MSTVPALQAAAVPAPAAAPQQAPAPPATAPAPASAPQAPLRVAREDIGEPASYDMPDTLTWLQGQMNRPGLSSTQVSALYELHQQLMNAYQQALSAWRA